MKQFLISQELATALLNYLASRPIAEALGLYAELKNIKEFIPKKDKKVEEPKPEATTPTP